MLRFDEFTVDAHALELRRGAERTDATPQAVRALILLASRTGRLVTRRELYDELWPDPDIDVDRGLNTLIRQLRRELGDDAGEPRFIRTYPRRGYRFLRPVTSSADTLDAAPGFTDRSAPIDTVRIRRATILAAAALAALVATVAALRIHAASTEQNGAIAYEEAEAPEPVREDFLAGRYLLEQSSIERRVSAVGLLESVTARAPMFAPAHARLASAYVWAGRYENARAEATHALEIDPESPHARIALGTVLLVRDWNVKEAVRVLGLAVDAAPALPEAHHAFAFALATAGRHDEAILQMQEAARLDPVSAVVRGDLGLLYIYAGRFEDAARSCRRAAEIDPTAAWAAECAFDALAALGRYDDAEPWARRLIEARSVELESHGREFAAEFRAWRADNAHALLIAGTGSAYRAALALAGAGRDDDALNALEAAALERGPGFVTITVDPRFRSLWSEPRFAAIAAPLVSNEFAAPQS